MIDEIQKSAGISGNLFEIGTFHGKSTLLLAEMLDPAAQVLGVCDLFGIEQSDGIVTDPGFHDTFMQNVRPAFDDSLVSFLILGAWQVCGWLLPFVFVFCAPRPLVFAQVAVIYLIRILLTIRFRTSWLGCALHPVGEVLALGIGLNSWLRSSRGGA